MGSFAPCSITREQLKRYTNLLQQVQKLFGRFSGSHPTSRPLPISYRQWNDYLLDLPATADNGCTQRRDHHGFSPCSHFAHSARIRAKPQSFFLNSQRSTTLWSFTEVTVTLQGKYLFIPKQSVQLTKNLVSDFLTRFYIKRARRDSNP